MQVDKMIADFSMELALDPAMPTYSGGLGILAGDTLRATALPRSTASMLDGWWIEGCMEGTTGWAVDSTAPGEGARTLQDANSLYEKLEQVTQDPDAAARALSEVVVSWSRDVADAVSSHTSGALLRR